MVNHFLKDFEVKMFEYNERSYSLLDEGSIDYIERKYKGIKRIRDKIKKDRVKNYRILRRVK